jgi:MoaA/NifB/PqqE/SkfB family radical SAM enzyme
MKLAILYRGPLSSCNYGCEYCPFAKHTETREEHQADRHALERFINWVEMRDNDHVSIFFTPWGEALVRKRYQDAFIRLTNMANVMKVAIQTNLSCRLDWVERCNKSKVGLWATYHPGETTRQRFLGQCWELHQRGVGFSVGVVGLKEHVREIEALRTELPAEIYLWINAYKRQPGYYGLEDTQRFADVDPLFPVNNQYHPSRGLSCHTGHSVISVDGSGTIRRCHFIKTPLGNIYEPGFEKVLKERPCTNATCGCHIGYIHMPHLKLSEVFGDGLLERVPRQKIW